jgi:hypothetical protein
MLTEIEIIREESGYALCHNPKSDKFTVVQISRDKGQVYSTMPTDGPSDGGQWFAAITDAGIRYVAGWYSRSYAQRIFRERVAESLLMANSFYEPPLQGR